MVRNGTLLTRPFLNITSLVSFSSEQGLLSMAFHPNYANNGRFFTYYTDLTGTTKVVRYTVSADPDSADAASAQTILSVRIRRSAITTADWSCSAPMAFCKSGRVTVAAAGIPPATDRARPRCSARFYALTSTQARRTSSRRTTRSSASHPRDRRFGPTDCATRGDSRSTA